MDVGFSSRCSRQKQTHSYATCEERKSLSVGICKCGKTACLKYRTNCISWNARWSMLQKNEYWSFHVETIIIELKYVDGRYCISPRGFTLLYFKMAVTPLVPETKTADVGKLISLGKLLARKTTGLVLTTTSAISVLSCIFGAYCMTKIVYKYSHLSTLILFPLWLPERTLSLSPFRLTESTQSSSFLHLTSSCQPPRKCIPSATILFFVILFRWDFFQPQTQKFHQTAKETNNQHGRRHMPSNTRCYIFIYHYLTWNT